MKRRSFLQAAPVAAALVSPLAIAQQQAPPSARPAGPGGGGFGQATPIAKLETAAPDEAGTPVAPRYFGAIQFATLKQLCEILQPAGKTTPSAIDAGVPEFLDFLIGESPADRQQMYKSGLDLLKGLDAANAGKMLAPLKKPWTYEPPKDPLTRFLQAAKADIRTATQNSREWAKAAAATASAGGRRGFGGVGLYWNSLDEA